MSKGSSGSSSLTREHIVAIIRSLPPKLNKKFLEDWDDVTDPRAVSKTKNRKYRHKETGLIIRFDVAKPGKLGFAGKDHYHVYNPNSKNKTDMYLDKDGNPVPDGSDSSHIIPKN